MLLQISATNICKVLVALSIAIVSTHRHQSVTCMQIGLYDTQSQQPSIKYVHMSGSSSGPTTPVDLEEAVPLHHLLAPVGLCKECIATAVDSLEPYAAVGTAAGEADSDLGLRSFGAALQAVLRSANCTSIYSCCLTIGIAVMP